MKFSVKHVSHFYDTTLVLFHASRVSFSCAAYYVRVYFEKKKKFCYEK